ncbi:hypothetical protein SGLAM104S_01667 [Streptomyces glaucescens]
MVHSSWSNLLNAEAVRTTGDARSFTELYCEGPVTALFALAPASWGSGRLRRRSRPGARRAHRGRRLADCLRTAARAALVDVDRHPVGAGRHLRDSCSVHAARPVFASPSASAVSIGTTPARPRRDRRGPAARIGMGATVAQRRGHRRGFVGRRAGAGAAGLRVPSGRSSLVYRPRSRELTDEEREGVTLNGTMYGSWRRRTATCTPPGRRAPAGGRQSAAGPAPARPPAAAPSGRRLLRLAA